MTSLDVWSFKAISKPRFPQRFSLFLGIFKAAKNKYYTRSVKEP